MQIDPLIHKHRRIMMKAIVKKRAKDPPPDANNKRDINADENLLTVFDGKKQVSMFEMTKLVNRHLSS